MTKRMILMLLGVGIVLGGLYAYKVFVGGMIKKYIAAASSPAQTVSTAKAETQDWQPKLSSVGTLRALNGADLSPELAGVITELAFDSGTDVKAGTVLAHLRTDNDEAHLRALQAAAALAAINLDRDQKQFKTQAISKAAIDSDTATLASNTAAVDEQKALIEKKIVRAPFDGRVGIRQVDIGQYINAGTTVVTLQQLDPIYVDFNLPERDLGKISDGQKVALAIDARPDETFTGEITAINAKVDEATRNIMVRATVPNPDRKLTPGMFANVTINVEHPQRYLTLPQTAVVFNPYGNVVYTVTSKGTNDKGEAELVAQQNAVVTGDTRGDQIAVLSGIKEGDEIVTSGQLKLRNGSPITVNNSVVPTFDSDPKPHEH